MVYTASIACVQIGGFMDQMRNKHWKVKAFAELTGLTVRTLHHYEEIGLLKPSAKTASNYRLYGMQDVLRIQQISVLKFLGYSLQEIKQQLDRHDYDATESLRVQGHMLDKKAEQLHRAARLSRMLARQISVGAEIDWDTAKKLMELMQIDQLDMQAWLECYLTEDEQKTLESIRNRFTAAQLKQYEQDWKLMHQKVRQHVNEDPASEIGLQLAQEWWALVNSVYGDYPELRRKMGQAYHTGMVPRSNSNYDEKVVDFIFAAFRHWKHKIM